MALGQTVYTNGVYDTLENVRISPLDRGFLFGHGAYEVTAVFRSTLLDFDRHITRLDRTLAELDILNPHSRADWRAIHEALIDQNGLEEGMIYLQVTAGAYDTRDFAGPDRLTPTIFLFTDHRSLITDMARDGITAILVPDTRWARRDLKTTQLLSQALAYRQARREGAYGALLVEDGLVTEGASANAWIVTGERQLVTRHLSNAILPGITRSRVKDLAEQAGLSLEERPFSPDEAISASEVFTTSATGLVLPIIQIGEDKVSGGLPGPLTRQLQRLYYEDMGADLAARAPWLL